MARDPDESKISGVDSEVWSGIEIGMLEEMVSIDISCMVLQ